MKTTTSGSIWGAVALAIPVCFAGAPLPADTIILKNGAAIHGAARRDGESVVVRFGLSGRMVLDASAVLEIRDDDRDDTAPATGPAEGTPRPAAARTRPVRVILKKGTDRFGTGRYVGTVVPGEDERLLVLEVAGGGKIEISRASVERIEELEEWEIAPRPAVEEAPRTVKTTHVVTLENGRRLRGTLVGDPKADPVQLRLGSLGVMRLRARDIAKIEESAGVYTLPEPAPSASEPAETRTEERPREELKAELRREIIREMLEGVIDRKIDEKIRDAVEVGMEGLDLDAAARKVPAAEARKIRALVRELTRQRTTNRVRAETALGRIGPAALPFLRGAAAHPFELTRRAVQRIVREVGDVRGIPLAIGGLTDSDPWVRRLASRALQDLLPLDAGYRADAPAARRRAAQSRYLEAWRELRREALHQEARARL